MPRLNRQKRNKGAVHELAVFAGAGGAILGGRLLGWRTVCAVELDAYAAAILAQRQNDGCLDVFPIWSDVCTFDGRPFRRIADVVSLGFPCNDISPTGPGFGIDGPKSSLWSQGARIIREVQPAAAVVENSPRLTSRGLYRVLGDLAEMGFDCEWGCLSAADAIWLDGVPAVDHQRERIWIVAIHPERAAKSPCLDSVQLLRGALVHAPRSARVRVPVSADRRTELRSVHNGRFGNGAAVGANAHLQRRQKQQSTESAETEHAPLERSGWWQCEPPVGRVVDGLANRVDRLHAAGNGQVPAVAALAWRVLRERHGEER